MKKILVTLMVGICTLSYANATEKQIKAQLDNLGITDYTIIDSPLPNFKFINSPQGIIQISDDGRFVIEGQVLEIKGKDVVNITTKPLMTELNNLKNEMIVYPARNEKYVVTVFTDISCGYCKLLHSQIKDYNDLGITIRYLAYPRAGIASRTASKMESIWQAKDRNYALDQAKLGNSPKKLMKPTMIKKHYKLGQKFGIGGTPNMVTSKGDIIGGYVEPKVLLRMLKR